MEATAVTKAIEGRLSEAKGRLRSDKTDELAATLSGPVGAPKDQPRGRASSGVPLLALQRSAGNAAVTALVAGKKRASSDEAVAQITEALEEIKKGDPNIDEVERGLKHAKDAGVPVDLEGEAQKPPPSALEVAKPGFDPSAVPPKPSVPPSGKTPPTSPLAKVSKVPSSPKEKGKAKAGGGAKPRAPAGKPDGLSGASGAEGAPAGGVGLVEGTATGDLKPPVPPVSTPPEDDPGFAAVTGKVSSYAKAKASHAPAASKAKEAQDAAVAPPEDVDSQAKAAKVDTMAAQQPGGFDKKAFVAAVKSAIEAKSPRTLEEADEYKDSGKAAEVKGEVKGLVTKDKEDSQKDIEAATNAPPDASKAVQKPVAPMSAEDIGKQSKLDPTAAVPKPAPAEQTNLEHGKHQVDEEMAQADVTEQQLEQSNESEFTDALGAKKQAAAHADAAPQEFRKQEQSALQQTKKEMDGTSVEGMAGMHGSKASALAKVMGAKAGTKDKDEQKRAEVTAKIQSIYTATETDVKKILDALDPKVERAFEDGEKGARAKFEKLVAVKMSAYKKDRYGGWLGGLRWAKDKLLGMPPKVNEFFEAGRQLYLKEMDKVISNVADIVGGDLTAAKNRIAQGRKEIAEYVKALPADLQTVGQEAADDVGEQFAQLESDVDAKQQSMVDSLAAKYVEARKGLDERIEQLQAENRGLVDKAIGAIKKVVATIKQLKDMLLGVLASAAGVIGKIIKNPIGFLGSLIAGVKGGILKFKDNILSHLKKGLMSWLFGALGEAGIQLPDTFDLKGIIKLITSLLGLTWNFVRSRLVKKVGEKATQVLETGLDVFVKLKTEGPAALWQDFVAKIGDVKEMLLGKVRELVMTKVIVAGITWLIGLLNPAAGFIKACKLIYDIIMFFVRNAARLVDLVKTIVDSVAAIAAGQVGTVVNKIDQVLGKTLPVVISFLASVIGLGGIGRKIRSIVETLAKPVKKALDAVIGAGLKAGKTLLAKAKSKFGRRKERGKAGSAAKDKVKQDALQEANTRLKGIRKIEDVGPALAAIRRKHKPLGLKTLGLTASQDLSSITVTATASAGLERRIPFEQVFAGMGKAKLENLRKIFENKAREVAGEDAGRDYVVAAITVDGRHIGQHGYNVPKKGGNPAKHAEKVVVEKYWDSALDLVREKVVKARNRTRHGKEIRRPQLVFAISASPCQQCSGLLYRKIKEVRADPVIGQDADFILAPRTPYEGGMHPEKKTLRPDLEAMVLLRHVRGDVESLELGWDLRQLATKPKAEASWERHLAELAHKIWEKVKKAGLRR